GRYRGWRCRLLFGGLATRGRRGGNVDRNPALREQIPQPFILVVDRGGGGVANQSLVETTELDALIDELLAPVGLGLHRAVLLDKDDVGEDENDRHPRKSHRSPIEPSRSAHTPLCFLTSASGGGRRRIACRERMKARLTWPVRAPTGQKTRRYLRL